MVWTRRVVLLRWEFCEDPVRTWVERYGRYALGGLRRKGKDMMCSSRPRISISIATSFEVVGTKLHPRVVVSSTRKVLSSFSIRQSR